MIIDLSAKRDAPPSRRLIGLIKFFQNEHYLDLFLSGCFFCNTPEHYRLSKLPGVSDKNESALYTYRHARGDSGIKLKINDVITDEVTAITIHRSGFADAYLHCWALLEIPKTEDKLASLKVDLVRMRLEFGEHYAFLPLKNLKEFTNRITASTTEKVWCQEVDYSASINDWSVVCKSNDFSYQREFRFGIEGCKTHSINPLILQCESGFSDLVHKSPSIELGDQISGVKWLEILPTTKRSNTV